MLVAFLSGEVMEEMMFSSAQGQWCGQEIRDLDLA